MMRRRHEPRPALQTKLVVGPAVDRFEREADSVAKRVMAELGSGSSEAPAVRRQSIEDEELLQGKREPARPLVRRAVGAEPIGPEGGELDAATSGRIEAARGRGRPLDDPVRRSMEGAFGADFSAVRVHDGAASDRLNGDLGARAFTTGSDIFVRSGEYRPSSRAGAELLAHELTHVVQQGAAPELLEG